MPNIKHLTFKVLKMKKCILFTLLLLCSKASDAQILNAIKAMCEQRAIAWTGTVKDKQTSYKGNMSIEDVQELGNNKIKVIGYYDIYTAACGLRRTKFECEIKKILDSMEIQSFCRLGYTSCFLQTPTTGNMIWYCYPH
jgi:hypothetical protein